MGATSGIGKEVAILLADKGWIVGIAGRRTASTASDTTQRNCMLGVYRRDTR